MSTPPTTNTTPVGTNKNKYDLLLDDEVNEHITVLQSNTNIDVDTLHDKTYSPIVCYCFTVNYVLGVGVLSMPYCFYHSGYVLSSVVLLFVTLMAIVTANYTSDSHARAQLISAHSKAQAIQLDMLSPSPSLGYNQLTQRIAVKKQSIHIYQFNELVEYFINKRAKLIYDICISFYMYGTLHMFASIVASSLASHIPIPYINDSTVCHNITADTLTDGCQLLYMIYIVLFACVVVPLTCRDLAEITVIQVLLAIFRFFALSLIIITSCVAIFKYPNTSLNGSDQSTSAPYIAGDIVAFRWSGLPVMLPAAIFSQIYHHSIPVLTAPLQSNKQKLQPRIWSAVLATTYTVYTAVSISTIFWYGSSISSPITLNYSNYDAGYTDTPYDALPYWVRGISLTVVLFPVLDIISAFPLNAITLGKNIYSSFTTKPISTGNNHNTTTTTNYKLLYRLLASVPPILFATFIRDLSSILKYTGCIGVVCNM